VIFKMAAASIFVFQKFGNFNGRSAVKPMSHLRFYLAILSHECATLSRDKVADAATVTLHAATLSHKQTHLLHHFPVSRSSFTDKIPK